MNTILQAFLLLCLVSFLVIITCFTAKKKLNLKYTLVWLFSIISMILITTFPQIVDFVGDVVGIVAPVNTVFLFSGMFMVLIIMSLTFIVSHLNNKLYCMAQEIALLEKKVRDLSYEQNRNLHENPLQ